MFGESVIGNQLSSKPWCLPHAFLNTLTSSFVTLDSSLCILIGIHFEFKVTCLMIYGLLSYYCDISFYTKYKPCQMWFFFENPCTEHTFPIEQLTWHLTNTFQRREKEMRGGIHIKKRVSRVLCLWWKTTKIMYLLSTMFQI